jgi:hypothetical protein
MQTIAAPKDKPPEAPKRPRKSCKTCKADEWYLSAVTRWNYGRPVVLRVVCDVCGEVVSR